jgi:hypothetical protein
MSFPRYQLSGAAKAPGGASVQAAVSAKLDDFLAEYLALYEQVRSARAQAHQQLSQGFFNMAEARHSMPQLALDATAYGGREMLPTIAWKARNAHPLEAGEEAARRLAELETPIRFEVAEVELKEEKEEDETEEVDGDESKQSKDGVRKRAGKRTAAEKEALALDDAPSPDDAAAAPAPAPIDLRSTPLAWFGVLAPPSLPAAAASFRSSLSTLAHIASLAQRLREIEAKFGALASMQQASHVDPAVEGQLVAILEKIKISDAKKNGDVGASIDADKQEAAASVAASSSAAAAQ